MREKRRSVVPPESLGGSVDLHESTTVRAIIEAWDKFRVWEGRVATKASRFGCMTSLAPTGTVDALITVHCLDAK